MKKILFLATTILLNVAIAGDAVLAEHSVITNTWTVAGDPTQATITDGPW